MPKPLLVLKQKLNKTDKEKMHLGFKTEYPP